MLHDPTAPPQTLRAANIEQRRRRILEATAAIIACDGMDALSMRRLAKEAKLAVTTLYNLFGSRDEIVAALAHDLTDRIDRILDVEAPLDEPIERCRAIITVSIAYIVEHETTCRPMFLAVYNGPTDVTYDRFGMPERAAGMQRVAIEAAVSRGLLRDTVSPDVLSAQIYHGYDMAAFLWAKGYMTKEQFEARALYGLYVALLCIATEKLRGDFEQQLARLEPILRPPMRPDAADRTSHSREGD